MFNLNIENLFSMLKKEIYHKIITTIVLITLVISCKQYVNKDKTEPQQAKREIDTSTVLIKYNNTLFTLPSPYQATHTIKKSDFSFKKSIVNPADNVSKYTTNFQKALNVGIYGTDLGYLNIYDQVPDVISYFTVIKKLSQELGIESALQIEIIDRIEQNIDNQDSLLCFLTSTYRQFDSYLKSNNRKEVGVLILAGGWIESLFILSQVALESNNRMVINRLGEQKHPLNNLIEILSPYYYKSKEYASIIDSLVDLAYEFDGIIYTYSYEAPQIDTKNKMTIINSTSNVIISEYHLKTIANKISSIRNNIIYQN